MNLLSPIYTEKTQCQDCYKCVRNCMVKTIKIEHGCATVMPEGCIFCGNCVNVCPHNAKRVRDDLIRARRIVAGRRPVYCSIAPSYLSAFPDVTSAQMVHALKSLGFAGVSETALGAQEVSAHVAEMMKADPPRVMISSACPAIVAYIQRHRPEHMSRLTPLLSPMLTHAQMLKNKYGSSAAVVFIGPCIAKKLEADAHPDLIEAALTFDDLREWAKTDKIDFHSRLAMPDDVFVPERASDGAIYAIDGGMIAGVRGNAPVTDWTLMSFSGMTSVQSALAGLEDLHPDGSVLLELLACEGGCVNGPRLGRKASTVTKRYEVLRRSVYEPAQVPRVPIMPPPDSAESTIATPAPPRPRATPEQVREVLRLVGKQSRDDELNCGGCGYDSCFDFGEALLAGKAEQSQCVTYMRQLAHKKANALIQKMPAAVVIVDQSLKIVEHNVAFVQLVGQTTPKQLAPTPPSLTTFEGAALPNVVPFHRLFASVLRSGEDILDRDVRYRDTILHLSIFNIEKHCLVGGILQDVTKPSVQKEQVKKKAKEVIRKNLETVQKIAFLLGENASESEITLNTIIDSFSSGPVEKVDDPQPAEPTPPAPEGESLNDWRQHYRR